MEEYIDKILSKVKETMDSDDIRKLGILPINSPEHYWSELLKNRVEGYDLSAGGFQLEQLKDIIIDIMDGDGYPCDYSIMCWYINEVLYNIGKIQIQ